MIGQAGRLVQVLRIIVNAKRGPLLDLIPLVNHSYSNAQFLTVHGPLGVCQTMISCDLYFSTGNRQLSSLALGRF